MILNHSKTISVISLLCSRYHNGKHSRDITLLIVLRWFNIMNYSNLFQYFLSMCYGPYSSWKFQIFSCTCLLTFFRNYDWWTHAYRIWNGTARPSYINCHLKSEVSITLHCQLCSTRYTVFRIKNCSKSTSTIHAYQKKEIVPRTPIILIIARKVKYPLRFYVQPVTQQYESRTVWKAPLQSK